MGFDIYGSDLSGVDFAALDLMLIPCASRITLHDGREIGADKDCIWEKKELINYMSSGYKFLTRFNQK